MKINVITMVQDPAMKGIKQTEVFALKDSEACYLDGPISERVAVLDFDPDTGDLLSGAKYIPPKTSTGKGEYKVNTPGNYFSPSFYQTSVFGTVLKTIQMFEEPDVLGRPINWAFNAPQLLVVPIAGQWANAFYHRGSHSLQFFVFPSKKNVKKTVYTCLSHDIVCHETGHAVLDGICPDLYSSLTPESRGLHEAVADLTALVMAFRSSTLRKEVLKNTGGSINDSSEFSTIASEFGSARRSIGGPGHLRNLKSSAKLNLVDQDDPYALCSVLTGAIYAVAMKMHSLDKRKRMVQKNTTALSASGFALFKTHERLKRFIFRALDYLPPGEATFVDYGRAIIAADTASNPKHPQERNWLTKEFISRNIISKASELNSKARFQHPALKGINFQQLVSSDWAAYDFVEKNRSLFCIPKGVPFEVEPRKQVRRKYYIGGGKSKFERECLIKVKWDHEEANRVGFGTPSRRRIKIGTTVSLDMMQPMVRAVVTSQASGHRKARDMMLTRLIDEDIVSVGQAATGPDGRPLLSVIQMDTAGDCLRLRGASAMLHPEGVR